MAIVHLKEKEGRLLRSGGAWVFDNEIASVEGSFENGDIVSVVDHKGSFLGKGFINDNSKIRIRILTRKDVGIDPEFLEKRVRDAWEYRKKTVDTSSCRLIFGEADFLPGLVADKYEDVLVIQSLALGMDKLKVTVVEALKKVLAEDVINIRGVFERNESRERLKEGLEQYKGFMGPEFSTDIQIVENNVKYNVDIRDGQKTGFFLDQKYNRLAIQKLCKGASVLDCFTHTGSFALNAGLGGAREVTGVDASELAVNQARENAALNGLSDRVKFEVKDVFDYLPELNREGKKFDVVILDPPAFTKSRKSIGKAINGYREINMKGLKLVKSGGFLATCSCSHYMSYELFTRTINEAANAVHKRLRQVEFKTQSPDHPILWASDESYYLKFYIFQVVDED